MTRIGSLFSGYGGLDQAVAAFTGGTTAWVSDIDKGANKILAHRYPDAPNLGDIANVDWSAVEPVDILTGGFPCQDVSTAGKRAGIRPGTRSGLWNQMGYAISELKPKLVVIENVRGLLSAAAHSDVEPCPICLGNVSGVHLRALGAVLGDLADLGYDAGWYGLRAADVGACHGRFRVFVVAHPAGNRWDTWWPESAGIIGRSDVAVRNPEDVVLLPTPAVNDMGAGKTVDAWDAWDAWTDNMRSKHGNGNGHGKSLHVEAARLLPTPTVQDGANTGGASQFDRNTLPLNAQVAQTDTWGVYRPAINRWEQLNGPAPDPTEPGKNGNPRLSPRFTEWMMGLPTGWITDVPGITRNDALKACGNGVVPQQAFAALRRLFNALPSGK